MRLFIALTLPSYVKKGLFEASQIIHKDINNGNFTHQDNYHVTLFFIGKVNEEKLIQIKAIINDTAKNFPPIFLKTSDVKYFEKKNKKILYFDLIGNTALLQKINQDLYNKLFKLRLCKKQTAYIPHITFARNVKCANISRIESKPSFCSGEITLMHSTRINSKLMYLPIFSSPLNGVFTIDRIEENLAVCEHNNDIFNIDTSYLPTDIKEGSKIRYQGLNFEIDHEEMLSNKKRIQNKFEDLKGG